LKHLSLEDSVLCLDGVYRQPTEIIRNVRNDLIKIHIENDYIICTPEHRFLVERDGELLELEAEYIELTDKLITMRECKICKKKFNANEHSVRRKYCSVQCKQKNTRT